MESIISPEQKALLAPEGSGLRLRSVRPGMAELDSSFNLAGASLSVNRNTTKTQASWATAISKGPANESTQTVAFTVTNNKTTLFTQQPAISATGTLTFRTGSVKGTATVSVKAVDNGGTANGGVDTSVTKTFTITVK